MIRGDGILAGTIVLGSAWFKIFGQVVGATTGLSKRRKNGKPKQG
jgi:hypothetical protein